MGVLALAKRVIATAAVGLVLFLLAVATAWAVPASPPVIKSFSPTSGPGTGGTVVTITGTGFQGTALPQVLIGGVPATNITVNSDTELKVTTPPYSPPVTVKEITVTVDGQSFTWPAIDYVNSRYGFGYTDPQPGVAYITPASGPAAGGTAVTITGDWFSGASAVVFGGSFGDGGTPATSFTVVDGSTITAVAPAGIGTVDIWVVNPTGTSNCPCAYGGATASATFTYIPLPVVTKLTRNGGAVIGGDSVVITGTGFTGATEVSFGTTDARSFTVDSDTQITAVSPANTGNVYVKVTTPGGASTTGAGNLFYYGAPAPTFDRFEPPNGPAAGHDGVAIYGSGFTGVSQVLFGSTPAVQIVFVNDGHIGVEIPPGTGTVDVTIETPGGSVTAPAAFFFAPDPEVLSLSPNHGPEEGGNLVTVTGSGFTGTQVQMFFGDTYVPLEDITVLSDTSLTAIAPAGTGIADVTVITRGGTSLGVPYTYTSGPPQDSVNAELVQKQLTSVVAGTSGNAITGAIAKGIAQGFSGAPAANVGFLAESAFLAYAPDLSQVDPFAEILGDGELDLSRPWNVWLDVQGSGLLDGGSGQQLNITGGLGYRLSDELVAGLVVGREFFRYTSTAPSGLLTGNGLSAGAYTGWRFSTNGTLDAALVWTGLGYDITSGAATGHFDASRWLLTSGLTGDFELTETLTVSPSARVYALWEGQESWTDSLATVHAARAFSNGTITAGNTFSGRWMLLDDMTVRPYFGTFADYRFDYDGTTTSSTFAARLTGGVKLDLSGTAAVDIGGELSGLGSAQRTWSLNAAIRGAF